MRIFIKKCNSSDELQREINCYKLLKNSNHVPKLIEYDFSSLTISIQYAGLSVWDLQQAEERVTINNHESQLKTLINDLEDANILHLDINPRNLLINHGQIYLIDFEKSCIGELADNQKLLKRRLKTIKRGSYKYLYTIWLEQINSVRK
jgi:thiamine kinase-like enzyme